MDKAKKKQLKKAVTWGLLAALVAGLAAVVLALALGIGFLLVPKGWGEEGRHHVYRTQLGTKLRSEWYIENGRYYYFDSEGHMATDFMEVDGKIYYFGETDGRMRTGWQRIDGTIYYFGAVDGRMRTGVAQIDGKSYTFSSGGKLIGWPEGAYPRF